MNALRNIDEALVTGGLLIDTQPVSPHPPVNADGGELGTLDMSDWARTIDQIDGLTDQTLRAGIFTIVDQRRFTVTDHFDTGAECVADVREWAGTRIDPALLERIAGEQRPVRVHQEVRLRVLQTCRHWRLARFQRAAVETSTGVTGGADHTATPARRPRRRENAGSPERTEQSRRFPLTI